LDAFPSGLGEAGWNRASRRAGWTVRDMLRHLAASAKLRALLSSMPYPVREAFQGTSQDPSAHSHPGTCVSATLICSGRHPPATALANSSSSPRGL
jgi:Mycothiol maleylpyruvate isomerase N-terminal domain